MAVNKDYDKPKFDPEKLSKEDKENFEFVEKRIGIMQRARREMWDLNIENIWKDADRDYVPHRLKTKGKRVIAQDETLGWRGSLITLGASDWQSDISYSNVFIKIQTALAVLIDKNPTGVFTATAEQYQATSNLIKQLYQRSWEYAKSKQQLRLFVFNLAKYGWAIGRTYPLLLKRDVKNVTKYDLEDPSKNEYEKKEVIEYNDIYRENLDPWNCWIDDMTRPNNTFSMRDWTWRKVYAWDQAKEEFSKYPNWKFVTPGGITSEKIQGAPTGSTKTLKEEKLVEVYFYENRMKDLYMVIANGVPVIIEPLPVSDASGNKKLSCWQAYWNVRHAECPYGIGVYESIRYDQAALDRIRNMTIDQLTLSIYKMFFYQGTQALTETGDIKIAPGVGKQVLDPKNVNFLQVPGPGAEAWAGIAAFKKDADEASGINPALAGASANTSTNRSRTAFELAQERESALKRISIPLDNITDSLEEEAYITISLIQLMYSKPEVYQITNRKLINDYMNEIQSDKELYHREDGKFYADVFPQFPLNLEPNEKGHLIETAETRFFRTKPSFLKWEGIVRVKAESVLTPSKQVDKALEMEMYNVLIPLLGQPPQLFQKIAKNIVKLYDKDPRDILPDMWLQDNTQNTVQQGAQGNPRGQQAPGQPPQAPTSPAQAPTLIGRQSMPSQPQSVGQKLIGRAVAPLRKV